MRKIGITGGVGSGKSQVLGWMKEKERVYVCQADLLAHELQKPGNSCYDKIVACFGKHILGENGEIDRGALGRIVFSDSNKLNQLNDIVHPEVNHRIIELMHDEEEKGTELFVLEAALLHEPFYREILDEIWYIHVSEKIRRERLSASRGYSDEKMTSMMANQPSEERFFSIADRVIENDCEFSETIKQLEHALEM